jgi:hypothetical protein
MRCLLCGRRKARRACPALGREICPVCCGTKREVEIRCPASCQYLGVARAHPPATVKRQLELDLQALMPALQALEEDSVDLFWALLAFLGDHQPADPFLKTTDGDVADAAGSLAATLETAARGVIYDHRAASLPAQRLAADFQGALKQLGRQAPAGFDRRAAAALRGIERGAREAAKLVGGSTTAYLEVVRRTAARLRAESGTARLPEGGRAASNLILP